MITMRAQLRQGRLLRVITSLALLGVAPLDRIEAQAVTGVLQGSVVSAADEPLRGVLVTIRSAALQGERSATSNAEGRFSFLAIPAGKYTVQLRRIGYAALRVTNVVVQLGSTTSLGELRLQPQAIELGEITISGARPLIDPTSAASATMFDSSRFLSLPTARDFISLLAIAPLGNASQYGDGVNVAGATGFENGYFIDGIHATDPLMSNGSISLPYNFIREVQVVAAGYEAEYGRSQGAAVSVITNSGSNELHGEMVAFFTGNKLRAAPRWGAGQSRVERFTQYDAGASLGGPIARDRLWFYAAYNPLHENRDASVPGLGTFTDSRVRQLFAGKLTWRATSSTDVSFTLLGDPSSRNSVEGTGGTATVTDPRAVLSRSSEGGTAVTLQARNTAAQRLLLDGSLSRLDRRNDVEPRAGPNDDPVTLARFDDFTTNESSGNSGQLLKTRSVRTTAQGSVTILTATHTLKFGTAFEQNLVRWRSLFSYVAKYVDAGVVPADTVYSWTQVRITGHGHNNVPTVYAQDSWEMTRRLRVNAGLRWDGQYIAGDVPGITPRFTRQFAPRLGFVFQPGTLGDAKVFGSFGRFYEQIPVGPIAFWTGLFAQTSGTYQQNPLVDTTGGIVAGGAQVGVPFEPSPKGQHYDEFTLGYERRLSGTYRLGARGIMRVLRWVVDDAVPDEVAGFAAGNPGRGLLAVLPRATRRYSGMELTLERSGADPLSFLASYVLSRNFGNYTGLFDTDVGIGFPNGTLAFDFPSQRSNRNGLLPNDRPHVLKLSGSYRFTSGLTIGTASALMSGTPLSDMYAAPYMPYVSFVRPRGTAGRTPTTWNSDVRFAYDIRSWTPRLRQRAVLDVFNVGNQRRAVTINQVHYTDPDQSAVNPNYLAVTQYQAPLSARLGLVIGF